MQHGFSVMLLLFLIAILAIVGAGSFYLFNKQQIATINSFEECAKKYPVMESHPAQCNTPDGRHFVQGLSEEEKQKFISFQESSASATLSPLKTFKDIQSGIEFSYPAHWLYEDRNNGLYRYIVFGAPAEINHVGQKVDPYPSTYILLSFYPVHSGQSVEEARDLSKEMNLKWEDVVVAGINAKRVSHMGCVSGDCTDIIFPSKNMLFDFSVENSSNPDFQAYLEEVTETFKFTNK